MRQLTPLKWSGLLILALCTSAHGLEASPLFERLDVLDLELKGPLTSTMRDKRDRAERPFVLTVEGREITVDVRVRGKSRAKACRFPPLRLNFAEDDVAGSVLEGQGKLKLVTHCSGSGSYEQNVLEEYAAYRVFRLLSEVSFRVRLLRMRYVDTDKPRKAAEIRYAFVIEAARELAAREQGQILRAPHVIRSKLDADQAARVYLFQYLIGNTDWSLVTATGAEHCCHNIDLISIDGGHYAVPYDFDQSGLVNARYAQPYPGLGIRSVRTRLYRGYCMDEKVVGEATNAIVALESEIRASVASVPGSDQGAIARQLKYIDKFFDQARAAGTLAQIVEKRCLGR